MAQHEIFVADAAHFIVKSGAKRLINQAWKQGFISLRGARPGESEPVEIPFNEGGRVDCKKSRIVIGRLCTTYLSVTMKWPDVERMAQADFERQLREASEAAMSAAPPPSKRRRALRKRRMRSTFRRPKLGGPAEKKAARLGVRLGNGSHTRWTLPRRPARAIRPPRMRVSRER